MLRETDMEWVEFCARQHEAFRPEEWERTHVVSREEVAATALFLALSGEQWYGWRDGLEAVAQKLAPSQDFAALVRVSRFDYQRFGPMLRARLRYACSLS